MKIALITAGAGGMYCGSCMKDNALASALHELGHECLLIPCYTPLRLDEDEASHSPIFLGGLAMYLEQRFAWLRKMPALLARWLASPWLLRKVTGSAVKIDASQLAPMTLSMLRGTEGNQRGEIERLQEWLSREFRPDVILLSNVLLSGIVPRLKQGLGVPIVTTLQGDDVFLDELPEAARREAIALIRANCAPVSGHIATCRFYADYMAQYLGLGRESMHVVYPGIHLDGFPAFSEKKPENFALVIGYLARLAPEKGLHVLVDALSLVNIRKDVPAWRLRVAGYLAGYRKSYLEEQRQKAAEAGWGERFEYVGEPNRAEKVRFLESIDLFSVPSTMQEPKGLYVLEAMACGAAVVQPRHGSFPELLEATSGGLLVNPHDPAELAEGLVTLLWDQARREALGRSGQQAVHERFSARRMAEETLLVFGKVVEK